LNTKSAIPFELKHLGLKVYGNAMVSRDALGNECERVRQKEKKRKIFLED